MDGEAHVRATAAVYAISEYVRQHIPASDLSFAFLGTPSIATIIPKAAGVAARTRVQYARALASTGDLEEALRQAEKARDAYAARPKLRGSLEHAASLNGVAGILERLSRFDASEETINDRA